MCERNSYIQGYHAYRAIWDGAIVKELVCTREPHNEHDQYAVAINYAVNDIVAVCYFWEEVYSSIKCYVTGHGRYSVDLPQGTLRFHVSWFEGKLKEAAKIKKYMRPMNY